MRKTFFLYILLSSVLLILDFTNLSDVLFSPTEPLIVGFKKNIYQSTFHLKYIPNVLINYERIVSGSAEKQQLSQENRELRLRVNNLEKENTDLRRQLGAPLPPNLSFVPSDVISVSRFMEINSGNTSGVKKGMAVVDGITLIGRISQATDVRAQVQLLSDNELTVPVITSRGSRGNITGQLGEFVLFKDVLQKDPLFIDDSILTTGEGGFPKGLLIGVVVKIDSDDVEVYKRAQVKSYSNPSFLKKVYVIGES